MQKWQVISNQSDGANFMPSIEKLMYKQQVPACAGMTEGCLLCWRFSKLSQRNSLYYKVAVAAQRFEVTAELLQNVGGFGHSSGAYLTAAQPSAAGFDEVQAVRF